MAPSIYILNGPNLNLLGKREPHIYGAATLDDVRKLCERTAAEHDFSIDFRQSNAEHQLIDWIHEAREAASGIVINPAGYTHTSVALSDALSAADVPVIEVHISNIHKRESFRKHSYVSNIARGVICGLGINGYAFAVTHLIHALEQRKS